MADTSTDNNTSSAGIDLSQFYQVFFEEAGENLENMEQLLLELDIEAADDEELNAIFRCAHSIKGGAATFGFSDVAELTHQMETLLDKLRRHELAPTAPMVDVLLQSGDALKAMLGRHQGSGGAVVDTTELLVNIRAMAAGLTRRSPAAKRAPVILQRLRKAYTASTVALEASNPLEMLIATILSAQCTDARVNEVTKTLFRKYRRPEDYLAVPEEELREDIRSTGFFNQKARSVRGTCRKLVEEFGGEVPRTFEELEALPGVGHKTASVVMAQAFGVPAFPVDTHIHRLARRWRLSRGKNVVQTERDLKRLFPESHWNQLHLRIIFYGREHCTARGCDGHTCEICRTLSPRKPGKPTARADRGTAAEVLPESWPLSRRIRESLSGASARRRDLPPGPCAAGWRDARSSSLASPWWRLRGWR